MKLKYKILAFVFIGMLAINGFSQTHTYAASAENEVKIEDPVLEKAIRDELKLDAGTVLDAKALEKLTSLYPKGTQKIKSLKGLNKAVNLEQLYLSNQEITDISPIGSLYKLTFLAINHNQIQNVCPIGYLGKLQRLLISDNQIADIGCLSHLTTLTDLLASNNQISNVAPLAKLRVGWLDVSKNPVADIAPLSTLNSLHNLYVDTSALNEDSKVLLQHFEQSGVAVNKVTAATDTISGISAFINEDRVLFDHSPIIDAGTTLVQFRPLFEKLGFTIHWDDDTKTIQAEKQGVHITLQVDSTNGSLNGSPYTLSVAPRNVEGSVFVPIRFVGEAANFVVTWDSRTKTIYLVPTRSIVSADGKSKLTVGGKWLQKYPTSSSGYQMYTENGNNALISFSESKYLLDTNKIKSVDEYEAALKKNTSTKQPGITFSNEKSLKINGMDARQYSYAYKETSGTNYTVLQTVIEGKYSYFSVTVVSSEKDFVNSEVNKDYQNALQTFEEIKKPYQLSEEKFGALKPTDRLLDAAHYYRSLGFFEKDKNLTSQEYDNKFLEFYKGFKDWNPFDSTKYYNEFADLYLLEGDQDRVWLENTEADVAKGKNVYVDTLKWWSDISRGAFLPSDITETWGTEDGPVTINFNMYGQKRTLHPEVDYDYLDIGILKEINAMIKDSGYEFVAVEIDEEVFVTVLKPEEKRKMEQDRYMEFMDLE
ncbi:hypothetical protein A8709_00890 [Paenibacillus pectinilyticus]|uniref:Copper amine oxidase-like N-terminal domain-containing protein n=1 Tax=Paenibacillus pectinilyticus TaxID=512399 RepID=A0A1C1A8G1_9BACL|nr:stalk domain-containing protein [Paenibacillus pectinilyticus]OCT16902.1 hypothetical protein A8709_00890 [Paenibacillus pectinilyticus]